MKTLTIKLSAGLHEAITAASTRAQVSQSELVRRALMAYLEPGAAQGGGEPAVSALVLAGDLVGCFSGGPADLASNPRHLGASSKR
jgi:hypothetical protein